MQIPETPKSVQALDLMQRLKSYAEANSTWHKDGSALGDEARRACQLLYTNVTQVVEHVLAPLMDRATARELETFTMHDRTHGIKVAHLMWHILPIERQHQLTPPEIGMLVLAAFLHDVGMALSPEERQKRLAPDSSLWDNLEIDANTKQAFEKLRAVLGDKDALELQKRRAQTQLLQGEEVLLAVDTRERHATPDRYNEVLKQLAAFHEKDKLRVPDPESCLSYYGDSFREKLLDICVSHNQDAETLIERDKDNPQRLRFPRDFPVGDSTADLHMVAAALRIADILDFDRERTPPILFHYLVPGPLAETNISAIEWTKHLTISNWHIEPSAIVFRGRSTNHITHHAVVQFCFAIQEELSAAHATFSALGMKDWPFALPTFVKHVIHEEGYHYVPYRFELDDQRVYELLMGGAIYDNPLVALRELVQNSVDACKLRDSLTAIYDQSFKPDTTNRIAVRYFAPTEKEPLPVLEVEDSGTGMDAWIIERFFLKVGQSYYRSSEFNRTRLQLRDQGYDFAPVSEFGIGFLSCFLLADRVEVETAMWESPRGDTHRRQLQIDGPTRLIQVREHANEGVGRFKGTKIKLWLVRGGKSGCPSWAEITTYLRNVCQDLPYRINLQLLQGSGSTREIIEPLPMVVPPLPNALEPSTVRIKIETSELEGELAVVPWHKASKYEREIRGNEPAYALAHSLGKFDATLLRGGFALGVIPGWGGADRTGTINTFGRLRLKWQKNVDRRYVKPNLSRSSSSGEAMIAKSVFQAVVEHALDHVAELPMGILTLAFHHPLPRMLSEFAKYGTGDLMFKFMEKYDAFTLYLLGRNGWIEDHLGRAPETVAAWECGETMAGLAVESFAQDLLQIVLPRIAKRYIGKSKYHRADNPSPGTFVYPPIENWKEILKSWKSYISKPIRWQRFADFDEAFKDLLYYGDAINSRFEERLRVFSDDQLSDLLTLLRRLVSFVRGYTNREFTREENNLLQELIQTVEEAEIYDPVAGGWKLSSFAKRVS